MKSILLSIHPKWCAKIMNGDKTIEVRKGTALYKAIKKQIDQYGYADIYVYCTKGKDLLVIGDSPFKEEKEYCIAKDNIALNGGKLPILNGKVIFKFRCYKVEEIYYCDEEYLKPSCLSIHEMFDYLKDKCGTAIHISDLEIFDKPKELSEFNSFQRAKARECGLLEQCKKCGRRFNRCHLLKPLTTAPQSFAYIEVE